MFWDIFYALCVEKGTTPNAVCKKLNLSNATATHWKNGTMPKGDVLSSIADYLDCSVDYLLGRTDEPHMMAKKNCNYGNSVAFGDRCNNNSVEIGNVKEHAESEAKNEDEELLQLFHSLPIYLRAEFILAMHDKVIEQKEKENTKDTN